MVRLEVSGATTVAIRRQRVNPLVPELSAQCTLQMN
jgi:hypothetical protein